MNYSFSKWCMTMAVNQMFVLIILATVYELEFYIEVILRLNI